MPTPSPALAARRLLVVQGAVLEADGFEAAARVLASAVSRVHLLDRVSVGWVERHAAVVLAVSQGEVGRPARDAVAPQAAAMDEALDQETALCWPPDASVRPRVILAHARLARHTGAAGVCTVPLVEAGRCVGALCVERDRGSIEPDLMAELEHVAAFAAPLLALSRRAERPFASIGHRLARPMRRLTTAGLRRAVLAAGGLALLAALGALPVDAPVSSTAKVEGAAQRVLTAPSDGHLAKVHVRPGDEVRAGQALVELDDRDLATERLRWSSEAEQASRQATEALGRDDRGQYAVHASRAQQARARQALVDARIARHAVRAPFDGRVLEGDLTRSLGAPVRAGEVLMTVAPDGRHRIVLEVDERDIARVAAGATAQVSLAARPGSPVPLRVSRVSPSAAVRDGRNVFEVEALPTAEDGLLRPGFHGVARIDAGRRPLARVLLERPWQALVQQLWSWGW
jgi:RND family efflux transporter MFP subunit